MPRRPRIHIPGGLYHVILRGNNRQDIFFDNADRHRWMRLLTNGIVRYGCRIHAYCWMTNHVHMAVQVSAIPLGRMVGWVASQYSRLTNKKLGRTGHLFERRYRGKPVNADEYLLQLVRYIHLNPVAANLVDSPDQYSWSSHRAYLGKSKPAFLTTGLVLKSFDMHPQVAVKAYRKFMSEVYSDQFDLPAATWEDEQVLGDDDFVEKACRFATSNEQGLSLSRLIENVCREYQVSESELASPRRTRRNARIRAEIALAAQRLGIASLREVATRFNRSSSALSHTIRYTLHAAESVEQ